ncbi:ATP-binding protein [Lapidilactobacillus luobeiensis]|uniref:ATP-binding protein n=1 Tax=Lapidilactobacillus luobeiensis TaxID=2950371 RepID=UPI0021C445E7|nr:ATP-binding protein [Lapidilactobacillus luobeiensis]
MKTETRNSSKQGSNHEMIRVPSQQRLSDDSESATKLIDDIVLKNYLSKLDDADANFKVIPIDQDMINNRLDKIRLFKIEQMVYPLHESVAYKFASVFNAVSATNSAVVTIIDSDGSKTDFYFGIRSLDDTKSTQTSYVTLTNAMKGQFPGTRISNLRSNRINNLLYSMNSESISVVSCVANNKNKELLKNEEYLQGLEKFALAMQGNRYTAVIIADPTKQNQLNEIRKGYESVYSQLSPLANNTVSYGTNSSNNLSDTETSGTNESTSDMTSDSMTSSQTKTKNEPVKSTTTTTKASKAGAITVGALGVVGAALAAMTGGLGLAIGAAAVAPAITTLTNGTVTKTSGSQSTSQSESNTKGSSKTQMNGASHSTAQTKGSTIGNNQTIQLTVKNKFISDVLRRIDKQLIRLEDCESIGMWETAAYFLSDDTSVSAVAASTYKALMSGESSGIETSAINTWNRQPDETKSKRSSNELIADYVTSFVHPILEYRTDKYTIDVRPTNFVSSNELAIHMGLPRHSVRGFPVVEHTDFGKEVVKYDNSQQDESIKLGQVFDMGRAIEHASVQLDLESLAMHTFVVGATGSGKSNTIYQILNELRVLNELRENQRPISFMVIEPAKGEYKRIFGQETDVKVFGTNSSYTELLRINPFIFTEGIHVLEHVDRLIEIFNVCWPMYAAMPAVLKKAVLLAYRDCGWDLSTSRNRYSQKLFPTFQDLLKKLDIVIRESSFSDEVKSNYAGSLITRVESLTNGLNGEIFSTCEIDNSVLFDTNVIVDLSRVGSQETKSLLMGILVMRLSEYRSVDIKGANQSLRHVTVLEEAHNILPAQTKASTADGGDLAGKSVEMISNAIAEMRTYGEGFIIADQSPSAVDKSAIRNTNTKIVMRLPDEVDRRIAGKSTSMKDEQLDELARLPKGVAAIYQNDWLEPVLCKVDRFDGKDAAYEVSEKNEVIAHNKENNRTLIEFILPELPHKDSEPTTIEQKVRDSIEQANCSASTKVRYFHLLDEYHHDRELEIWRQDEQARSKKGGLLAELLNLGNAIDQMVATEMDTSQIVIGVNDIVSDQTGFNGASLVQVSRCLLWNYCDRMQADQLWQALNDIWRV